MYTLITYTLSYNSDENYDLFDLHDDPTFEMKSFEKNLVRRFIVKKKFAKFIHKNIFRITCVEEEIGKKSCGRINRF